MYTDTYRVLKVWTQHYFVPVPRHWFPSTKCGQPLRLLGSRVHCLRVLVENGIVFTLLVPDIQLCTHFSLSKVILKRKWSRNVWKSKAVDSLEMNRKRVHIGSLCHLSAPSTRSRARALSLSTAVVNMHCSGDFNPPGPPKTHHFRCLPS